MLTLAAGLRDRRPPSVKPTTVTTAIAKNYLSFARVLAASLQQFHPELRLTVLLCDRVDGRFDADREPFDLLTLEDLSIGDLAGFCRRYSRKQLAAAAKPYLLEELLTRRGGNVLFLDPDVQVLGSLEELIATVASSSITLTPHLLAPLQGEDAALRELNILLSGVFNAGFLGLHDCPAAHGFLAWWKQRVERDCRHDVGEGIYYDQRWLDLVPVFFDGVRVLRDPGCNVAHWNLAERPIRFRGDEVLAGEALCRFFHFSGFDPEQPEVVTRYSSRIQRPSIGEAALLFDRYAGLLLDAGYRESILWPSAYDTPR